MEFLDSKNESQLNLEDLASSQWSFKSLQMNSQLNLEEASSQWSFESLKVNSQLNLEEAASQPEKTWSRGGAYYGWLK